MAITIKNTRNSSSTFSGRAAITAYDEFARTTTIAIKPSGEVSVDTVDLGYSGDHHATCLVFDTTELRIDAQYYEQVLIFVDTNTNTTYSFELQGEAFLVPSIITSVLTPSEQTGRNYKIFYTLQEKERESGYEDLVDEDSTSDGNVANRMEIFISKGFNGIVKPSFWSFFLQNETDNPTDPDTSKTYWAPAVSSVVTTMNALCKSLVSYSWVSGSFVTAQQSLGEYLDSLITPLEFTSFPIGVEEQASLAGLYEVYFLFNAGGGVLKRYKFSYNQPSNANSSFKIWVPREITNEGIGIWQIGIVYSQTTSGVLTRRVVSNQIYGQVLGNELVFENLKESPDAVLTNLYSDLLDENGDVMLTTDEGNPPIQTIEASGNSAQLSYSGTQVNSFLGWISTNQTNIDSIIDEMLRTVIVNS